MPPTFDPAPVWFPPSIQPTMVVGAPKPDAPPPWSCLPHRLGKTLTLRAHFDALTGYGSLATGLIRELANRNYPCQALEMRVDGKPWEPEEWGEVAKLPDEVRERLVKRNDEGWELMMASPHHEEAVNPSVHLTMWESNRVGQGAVAKLNRKQALIVPSEWGILALDAAGCSRPMYKVNLPISDCFREYRPMPTTGPFTFGLCCRRAHGGLRKGVVQACECFLKAFPTQKDVRLRLKFYPDCDTSDVPDDPRIEVIRAAVSEEEVADFLASLHVYVSTSQAEGYGLVQCQAMGIGRPVIGAKAHAQAEYLSDSNACVVDYELQRAEVVNPANGYYAGYCFPVKDESVIEWMRLVEEHPRIAWMKGRDAHNRAAEMTWDKFLNEVLDVLKKEGLPCE